MVFNAYTVLKPFRKIIYLVFFTSFAIQLLALASPITFLVVIDKVISNGGLTTLYSVIFGLTVATIMEALLIVARSYIMSRLSVKIDAQLSGDLYGHLLNLPLPFFSTMTTGDISQRFQDTRRMREFFVGSLPITVIELSFCILYFVVLFIIHTTLTFIVIGAVIFVVLSTLAFMPFEAMRAEQQSKSGVSTQQILMETLGGIETLKSLSIEGRFMRRWLDRITNLGKTTAYLDGSRIISGQLTDFTTKIAGVCVLGFGAVAILSQELTLGQLIAFNLICARLWQPIMRGTKLWHEYRITKISLRRINRILSEPVETDPDKSLIVLDNITGSIAFRDVSFAYPKSGTPNILDKVSFDIEAGEVVGIEGVSGSGKSTLARLIQGFYRPDSGGVFIDDHDLQLCDPEHVRKHIGTVLQDNNLFMGSIKRNILVSNPDLPMQDMMDIAKLVGAHDFIIDLPGGYETYVTEHGQSLSMGQRQRIAWARALASDPRILILDEATSALDTFSQGHILDNFDEITRGRTVLVIAHKEEILEKTSRRLRLAKGAVIVKGE